MRKIISLLFVITALTFTLTGCGQKVEGAYHASAKFQDILPEETLNEMTELGFDTYGDLDLPFLLNLNEDKTYVIQMDSDALRSEFFGEYKNTIADFFKNMWLMIGVKEEQFDSLARQSGYDSFELFIDAYVEQMLSDVEAAMRDTAKSGTFNKSKKLLDLDGETAEIQKDGSLNMTFQTASFTIDLVFEKE